MIRSGRLYKSHAKENVDEWSCEEVVLLNGRKTGKTIFVVTPELKRAVADMVSENCICASAFISSLLADKALEKAVEWSKE
ncbi:hypothetical protein BBOU_1668 [Bifidobacterium boum]|uniref:Uncharacterized protein n=1 Tax=Bifidobacterium boum TaxID=78343 RepID=A0A086ZFA2_9BIFI|nr:hypothetical protein BBOU_1668 [Bifidobacterium boum]